MPAIDKRELNSVDPNGPAYDNDEKTLKFAVLNVQGLLGNRFNKLQKNLRYQVFMLLPWFV